MRNAGVKVGLGMDRPAINDAGNLVAERRQLMLQQIVHGADAMSAWEARAGLLLWHVAGVEGSWNKVALETAQVRGF